MTTDQKNYTLPIAMMFALFAMISFVTGLTNPLGVIVKNQDNGHEMIQIQQILQIICT